MTEVESYQKVIDGARQILACLAVMPDVEETDAGQIVWFIPFRRKRYRFLREFQGCALLASALQQLHSQYHRARILRSQR